MKLLLRLPTIFIAVLLLATGRQATVSAKQSLTGQDALNFLKENGIYNQLQLTPGAYDGFSPVGREFFGWGRVGATDGYTDDLFGISVARDGDTVLVGASQVDVDGNIDQGAVYVFTAGNSHGWALEAKLTADDGAADDFFGYAVALDGDTAVIGAYQADISGSSNQGAAYVFNRSGVFWSQTAKLLATGGSAEDEFGFAVALDGGTALVGAPLDDVDGNVDQGSVRVFTQNGGSWNQTAILTADSGAAGDEFGNAAALEGNTALIGAPLEDIGFDENQGAAYVFVGSGDSWSQEGRLATGDGAEDDELGGAVALSGDMALIGAHLANIGGNDNQGAAYVFTRDGGNWSQQEKLTADDGAQGDRLGRSVAVEGDTILLGAPRADIGGNGDQGAAYVFILEDDSWSQQSKLTDWWNGEGGDRFGRSVALDGDTALVGAIYSEQEFGNPDKGGVYPFARSDVSWLPYGEVTAQDGDEDDKFGWAVAVDGNTALVGAPSASADGINNQGVAYIFERLMGNWVQKTRLTNVDVYDWRFGYSTALEGDIAVVGAPGTSGPADQGGAAYIFVRESNGDWIEYDKLTPPVGNKYDRFGYSVALDGETILVGAPGKDINNNEDQGAAYIFIRENNSNWIQQDRLLAVDGAEEDLFGSSVALDGDTALVGAYYADIGGIMNGNQGAVYVFAQAGGSWGHQAKLTATDASLSDWFGYAVALEGDTALVGAYYADIDNNNNQGAVYVFTRTGSIWSEANTLTASDGATADSFGNSIVFEGNTILVGAHVADVNGNFDQGAVYIFTGSGSEWRQQAKIIAANGTANDEFGLSVALQGNNVLIGAPAADINGNDEQGKIYFFQRQPYEVFLPMVVR